MHELDGKSVSFSLKMQIPSGKNRIIITRTGHRFPGKRFVAWREEALGLVSDVDKCFYGPYEVLLKAKYVPGDNVRRDVTGMIDALFHLLERAGIIQDDANIKDVNWKTMPVKPHHPSCHVTLSFLRERFPSKKKKKNESEYHSFRVSQGEV